MALLTVTQAAKRLKVSVRSVYKYIAKGDLETSGKPEGCRYGYFVEESELDRFASIPRPKPGPKPRMDNLDRSGNPLKE